VKADGVSDADDELGGAAADVDDDGGPVGLGVLGRLGGGGWLGGGDWLGVRGWLVGVGRLVGVWRLGGGGWLGVRGWLGGGGRLGGVLRTCGSAGHGAEERELRLLLAAEDAGVQLKVVAHALGEVGAVAGIADGGGEHGEVDADVVGVNVGAVVAQRAEDPLDGVSRQRAVGVDALAEAGDGRAAEHLVNVPAVRIDVGDEQPGGVGPDVDDGDAHGEDARGAWRGRCATDPGISIGAAGRRGWRC
jgi:hypothetical protein